MTDIASPETIVPTHIDPGQAPRVTVLMSVYNGMPYLPQAIESVLNQTYRAFEFLIIDDGSTDGSVIYIEQCNDPRIRFVRNERNIGQAASLNKGLSLCRSPYVARLDQDDICLPDRLRRQVDLLEHRRDVDVVGTWLYGIGPHGRKTDLLGMPLDDYGTFLGALLTYASPVGHPTVMFRRESIDAVGGYDESFAPCEDYALWCRLARQRRTAVGIPRPLMMIRMHSAQQSRTRMTLQQHNARRAHDELVASLCGAEEAPLMSELLRMDEGFWTRCRTGRQVREALRTLEHLLEGACRSLRLSPFEEAHLMRRVIWWMGHGALLAIMRQQRQSLPVYLWILRKDIRIIRYPVVLAYPVCFLLSPLFVSKLRERYPRWVAAAGRSKYVVRLWISELLGALRGSGRIK